jgi:putative nucleotidyltransferase with HDIG domain
MSLVGILAQIMLYKLPRGGSGSIAFIPFLAASLIAPNWITVLAIASSVFVTEVIVRRRDSLKACFNVAQASLALSLGIACFHLSGGNALQQLGGTPLLEGARENVLPTILLIVVFFAANSLMVSAVIAMSTQTGFLHIWRKNTLGTVPYDVLASPIVYLLGWIYVVSGPVGATALCVPLLGIRQLYKTNSQLEQVNRELLELMVKAIEARDPYTSGHSRRVAHYSKLICRAIGLSAQEIERIGVAALLHDVGKIHEVYAPILRKPDRLTPDEWAVMQTHPVKGAELVATVSHLKDVVAPVRHHHENWDGTGYPDGLAAEEIPLGARVVLIADTIDAMTTDRPYRKAMGEAQVRSELLKCRGKQFDPAICDKLLASPVFGLLFAPSVRELTPPENAAAVHPPRAAALA